MKPLLLLALLLIGCGRGPNTIDPAFQPLYDQFITQANTAGVHMDSNQGVTIQFAALEQPNPLGETIGECSNVGWGNNSIQIDTGYWVEGSPADQQLLLYHELGHCLLDEIHTTNKAAIMNALINDPLSYYSDDFSGMLDEFFLDRGDGG